MAMAVTSIGIPHLTDSDSVDSHSVVSFAENIDPSYTYSSAIVIQPEEIRSEDPQKEFKKEYVDAEQEFYPGDTSVMNMMDMNGLIDKKQEQGLGDTESGDQHGFIDIKPQIGEVSLEASNEEESVDVFIIRLGRSNRSKQELGEYVLPRPEPLPRSMLQNGEFIPGPGMILDKETDIKQEIESPISPDLVPSPNACPVPPKKLKLLNESDNARTGNDGERNFSCQYCGEYFGTAHHWANHMGAHHRQADWRKCPDCGMEFKKQLLLVRHMKNHRKHDGKRHLCDVCGGKYKSEESLAYHKAQKHGGQLPKKCEKCEERFLTAQELLIHNRDKHVQIDTMAAKQAHLGRSKFLGHPAKCQYCPISFKKKSRLARHVYYAHTKEPGPLKCDFCDSRFKLLKTKAYHMAKKHGGPVPYTCEKCGKGFFDIVTLEKHIKKRHDPKRKRKNKMSDAPSSALISELKLDVEDDESHMETFQETDIKTEKPIDAQEDIHVCSDCGEVYTTKLRLMTHACKNPEHVTPQICPICLKGFTFQYEFDDHVARHRVDDECTCLMCPKRFKNYLKRNTHMRARHLQEDFKQCVYCSETFVKRTVLFRHEKEHTVPLAVFKYKRRFQFKCQLCRDRFESHTDVTHHIVTKHGGMSLHVCEICQEDFPSKRDLDAHVKNAHQECPDLEPSNSVVDNETSNSLEDLYLKTSEASVKLET